MKTTGTSLAIGNRQSAKRLKHLSLVLLWMAVFNQPAQAQDANSINRRYFMYNDSSSTLVHNWYSMNASEIIFSGGQVKALVNSNEVMLDNVVRFTAFLHIQQQFHYNFNNTFGLFTGIGLRNVGFINKVHINDSLGDATVKQRSYSIGIPLALKIGDMKKGTYLALGAEAEVMFAYKEKVLYDGQKNKFYASLWNSFSSDNSMKWFSDSYVNLFNPSLFADLRFNHGSYIRFKYYLNDFLKNRDMSFVVPGTTTTVFYQPESSKMFYVAIGTSFRERKHKKHHATATEV